MSADANSADHWTLSALRWLVSILLFLMMAITFLDVLGRYLLNAPIFGAAEMIQFLLAGTVFSGLILVSHSNGHIAVELFSPRIHARIPRLHDLIVVLFSCAGLLVIAFEFARIALHALEIDKRTIVLEWPIALVAVPATLFCLIAAAVQATWLVRSRS